jgi:hypothetical protein
MKTARGILLLAGLVSSGCRIATIGPSMDTFGPARSPEGVQATLRLAETSIVGELLEVQDTALLVLDGRSLVLVPYHAIRQGEFTRMGIRIRDGQTPSTDARQRIRLVSRFPQGLTPEIRSALLAAYARDEPTTSVP